MSALLKGTEKFDAIDVVTATIQHAEFIAPRMRDADVDECWASNRLKPFDALVLGLQSTRACWTGLYHREPFCMFGVVRAQQDRDVGVVWMLATDRILECKREFLRKNSHYVQAMRSQFKMLMNYVDDRNTVSKRWLEWLGFELEPEAVPLGPDKLPFRRFQMQGHLGYQVPKTRGVLLNV